MATPTLDAPDLSLNEHRALREGRDLPEKMDVGTSETLVDDKSPDVATVGGPETPNDTEEPNQSTDKQPPDKAKPPAPPKRALVDDVSRLRRENRELHERLAAQASPKPATPPAEAKPAAADDAEPNVEKYDDYVKWQKDWSRWDRRQADREAAAQAEQRQQQSAAQTRHQTWQERQTAARQDPELADYDAIALEPSLPVNDAMGAAITDSEIGPKILYYLGSNRDEAERIAKLTPIAAAREIGKIEAQLSQPAADAAAGEVDDVPLSPGKTVSKAPAPAARPQGGTLSKPNPVARMDSMTQAEYRAYRESGKIR